LLFLTLMSPRGHGEKKSPRAFLVGSTSVSFWYFVVNDEIIIVDRSHNIVAVLVV
jgi:hypothetical protein